MSKKTWIYIGIGVVLLIVIIYFATRPKTPTTVIVPNPTATVPSNQPTNNIAQIIAALGGLAGAVGGWGIFGSGSSNTSTGTGS